MRKKTRHLYYKMIRRFKTEQEANEYAKKLRKLGYKAQVLPCRPWGQRGLTVRGYI